MRCAGGLINIAEGGIKFSEAFSFYQVAGGVPRHFFYSGAMAFPEGTAKHVFGLDPMGQVWSILRKPKALIFARWLGNDYSIGVGFFHSPSEIPS